MHGRHLKMNNFSDDSEFQHKPAELLAFHSKVGSNAHFFCFYTTQKSVSAKLGHFCSTVDENSK